MTVIMKVQIMKAEWNTQVIVNIIMYIQQKVIIQVQDYNMR